MSNRDFVRHVRVVVGQICYYDLRFEEISDDVVANISRLRDGVRSDEVVFVRGESYGGLDEMPHNQVRSDSDVRTIVADW